MSTGTEMIIKDEAMLERIMSFKKKDDVVSDSQRIPDLRINYNEDSKHPLGKWVLGQKTDQDGNLVDDGFLVQNIAILTMRKRFIYFDQDNMKNNCQSNYFVAYDESRKGSKYGPCDSSCQYRSRDRKSYCRCAIDVFCLAFVGDKSIECIMRIKGANFMPFEDWVKKAIKIRTSNGLVEVPPFSFLTHLKETTKEKNGSVTYYVGNYERGKMFGLENIEKLAVKRDNALVYIDSYNRSHADALENKKESASFSQSMPEISETEKTSVLSNDESEVFDASESEDISVGADDFDIEKSLAAALKEDIMV